MMAFMKNINDLIGILALLVLTTPSLAANIDCNGKPFHCLNSTHFMICVDLGSVSSTIDDFVIPCPPTTVCKGTNKFECEFVVVTTTTIAPSVVPLTSVSEKTTPLYEVTTSIPFEEYYNTLSTTTLSEDILLTQHSATEPTIQPATDMPQNIDVTLSGSDLNSNFNDIVLSTINVQNNLATLWPTVISSTLSEGITTATRIAENDFPNLNTVTNTFLSNNVTESTLLQTKATPSVSTLSETIQSVDVVENDKSTDLMWATVTESTPKEITSSVQNNQQITTSLSNNVSTTASDLSSNTVEIASVAKTKPDKDYFVTETTKATETDQNGHTLLTALDIAMPINTEATAEPYTTPIPETTENIKVTANISLSNNAADNDSILLEASSSASVSEAISNGDTKNDTTTEFMLAGVTESTLNENTVNKSIPIVDVVQNSLKTIILLSKNVGVNATYYVTENTIVTETKPEMNFTLSEISDLVTTASLINVDTTTTPIPMKYIPETSKNIDIIIITPESGSTATSGLSEPLNTSFINNITNTVVPPTLVVVSDSVQSLDVVQNNFTTHHLINNAIEPILFEEAETTSSVSTLKVNTQNVEDVRNDFKVTASLPYDNSTNATDVISNATENVNVITSRPERNKTLIENSTLFSDTIANKITESIMMEATQTTPSPDIVNKYLKISTTLFNNINENVTEPTVYDVTENINPYESNLTFPESGLTATSGLSEPLNTSFINNITNTVIPPTLVVVSDIVQSLDVVQNNFTTHHLINNAMKPILFEEAETTSGVLTLKGNTQNVEDVRNDFKVTASLPYDNSTNARDVISNATENVNVPERNKTLIENSTFFPDTIANKITEPIMMEATQTTPSPDIVNEYLKISTTLFNNINDNVTEPTVYDVTENINLYESNLTLSVPALTIPSNVTMQNNFITKPVTDSTASNLPTTESINIPFTETVQTLPANLIMKITENPIHATTEYNADTSSENFSGQSTFYETDYIKPNNIQNKSVVQANTEHTATTANVLKNSLVNEINKSSITSKNYKDVPEGNSTTESLGHAATENYADSSLISTVVTDGDTINIGSSTLNPVLETTTFTQEVDSITYSHVNNHTDTENIGIQSDQGIFTNKTGGKPTLSEKVLSTGIVENTTIPPTFINYNNFTSSLVIATNTPVPKPTSRTDVDTLIMNTEATLFVNKETHTQADLVLGINTNDSVRPVSAFENYGSLHVNEIHSGVPVLATSFERTLTTEIPTGASDEAMVKPVSNDIILLSERNSTANSSTLPTMTAKLPVTTADTIQVITTDPATLGTIFTVTETSEVIFSETTNHVQAPHVLNTESAASQDFLTSPVYIDEASGTTLEASLKETNKSSINTINDATTPFTPNTKMSMDLFYSAKEVVATEAANNSNEPPLHTESSKSKLDKKYILTQITVPPLSAHNVPTEIVSTSEIQLTSVPLAVHLHFDTNLQNYETEQENSKPTNPDPFASSYKTDLPVQNIAAVGTSAKTIEFSLGTSGNTLVTPSTASTGVEAIRKPNNLINLLLDSPTKQIPEIITAAPTGTISLIPTAILFEAAADVAAAGELSKTTTETVPFADSRTEQDPDTEFKINNMGAHFQTAFPSKETLTNEDLHTILNINNNGHTSITPQQTSEKPIKHTQTLDVRTLPSIQVSDFQKPVIPSADTIVRSKPYIHITSSLDATQPTVHVSGPYTESPVTNDNTAQIVSSLNVDTDVSNSKTEHIVVPKYVTPPSNIDEKLVIEAKSTNRLTTESPNTIPHISESTVQTARKPILDHVIPDLGLVKKINVSNKGNFDLTTKHHIISPKTEFTKVPKVVDQTTVHIKNSIGTNLDKEVVIVDSVKTEVPVFVQNNVLTGTHLGISTLPHAKVQESENTEANESVEQPESPERNEVIQKTTSVIDRTITESSKLLDTNDTIPLERTIEITTKKMEDNSERDQSITNIESTVKSPTLTFAETNADNRSPKEKSVTNIHNTSLPIVKTVTNSQNFVCKLNNRGRFSDSNDCRKFYICIGRSEPIVGFCPNNTVFSELWKQCTKNLSHCVRNNKFQCVREGRFSDFLNDKNYYICVKNNVGTFIRFKLQCQSGYHLNKTSVHCELNTESSQSTSQMSTSSVSINSGSEQSVSSVKSEKLVNESSNKFECKEEGKFPDADNCRKYYVCKKMGKSQYRRKSKKCNSDDLFDKDKKKCVDADSHECS